MNRDLDALIAEKIYGWKIVRLGPDASGKNACDILTEHGKLYEGYSYPPGVLHKGYQTPRYSSDLRTALEVAQKVGLNMRISEILEKTPEQIAEAAYKYWEKNNPKRENPLDGVCIVYPFLSGFSKNDSY